MNPLFEKNWNAFERRYPSLAGRLRDRLQAIAGGAQIQSTASYQLGSEIRCRTGLFLGTGDGIFLKKIHRRIAPHRLPLLIVEPSLPTLKSLFLSDDFSTVLEDPCAEWVVAEETQECQRQFSQYISRHSLLGSLGDVFRVEAFPDASKADYLRLEKLLIETATDLQRIVMSTPPEDGYQGFLDIARNLDRSARLPIFDRLEGLFKGKTGVVVSSGPSLTPSLPLLRRHQQDAVIFCVDSSLKLLLREGIRPHFTASLERVPQTAATFDGMPCAEDTWLVANPLSVPEVFENYKGPQCSLMRQGSALGWFFPDVPIHDLGISVAHMAYWGLHLLGCDPIILVGQDLAFDRHSIRSHAEGTPDVICREGERTHEKLKAAQGAGGDLWVEGNNGEPILTCVEFKEFIPRFGSMIWSSGRRCINAIQESRGARIPHSVRKDPEEAFEGLEPLGCDARRLIRERLTLSDGEIRQSRDRLREKTSQVVREMRSTIIPVLLDILDELSVYFQYHLPWFYEPGWDKDYLEFLDSLEKKEARISGGMNTAYLNFLMPLIHPLRMNTLLKTSDLRRSGKPFSEQIQPLVECLQSYYREQLAWSERIANLFDGVSFNAEGR